MSGKFSNQLSDAQIERLAILAEEMGEVQQVIGKILRHGYESRNPLRDFDDTTNRELLEKELAHVLYAAELMQNAKDVSGQEISEHMILKADKIKKWLHHQASA